MQALKETEAYRDEKPPRYGWKDWKKAKANQETEPMRFAEMVADIQRRLKIDGYFNSKINGVFNAENLVAAIAAFEANSELKPSEHLRQATFYKLSPNIYKRIQRLKLNLQRYRESIPNRHGTSYLSKSISQHLILNS